MVISWLIVHNGDVIMNVIASQITSLVIVYSTVYSRRRSKKTSKHHVTGLRAGNSLVTGEFLAQKASYAEMLPFDDVIMWSGDGAWRRWTGSLFGQVMAYRLCQAMPLPKQPWLIVHRTIMNKIQWHLNQNMKNSFQENVFKISPVKRRLFSWGFHDYLECCFYHQLWKSVHFLGIRVQVHGGL